MKCLLHSISVIRGRELSLSWQALTWKSLVVGAYIFSKTGTALHYHGDRALPHSPQQQQIGRIENASGGDTFFFMTLEAHVVQGEET